MTIKKLKNFIHDLPDDMKIGGSGHFGEYLECWDISVEKVYTKFNSTEKIDILSVSIENPGPEPD